MKCLISLFIVAVAALASTQGHDLKPADAMQELAFMKGDWSGTQDFNTQGGPAMSGKATNKIDDAIGGRYLCEMLSTTMPGRKPTDTRHFISFDPKAGLYRAWWFTDTSVGPMEFEGKLTGKKLVLETKPMETGAGPGTVLRATYESPSAGKLTYTLEMQRGGEWIRLFTTTYTRN